MARGSRRSAAIAKNRVVDEEMIQIADGLFEEIGSKAAGR